MWLVGLQNVFSHQLPRMPKEYITRLVFDPWVFLTVLHHHSSTWRYNEWVSRFFFPLKKTQDPVIDQGWESYRRNLLQDVSITRVYRDCLLCRHIKRTGQGERDPAFIYVQLYLCSQSLTFSCVSAGLWNPSDEPPEGIPHKAWNTQLSYLCWWICNRLLQKTGNGICRLKYIHALLLHKINRAFSSYFSGFLKGHQSSQSKVRGLHQRLWRSHAHGLWAQPQHPLHRVLCYHQEAEGGAGEIWSLSSFRLPPSLCLSNSSIFIQPHFRSSRSW